MIAAAILFLVIGFKVLFLVIPLLLAVVFNLLPIFLLFYLVRRALSTQKIQEGISHRSQDHTRFVELLVHILVHAFKADGQIDSREIAVTKAFFVQVMGFNSAQMAWVQSLMDVAIKANHPLDEIVEEFNRSFNHESKMIVLQLVYRVVFADHHFSQSEKDFVNRLVRLLKLTDSDHERIRALFVSKGDDKDRFYRALGLKRGATKAEIKKAYRNLVKEYHPDKVHHLGTEFREVAEEKVRKINEAYEALSDEHS